MNNHKTRLLRRIFALILTIMLISAPYTALSVAAGYDLEMDEVSDLTEFLQQVKSGGPYNIKVTANVTFESAIEISDSIELNFFADSPMTLISLQGRHFEIIGEAQVALSFQNVILDGSGSGGGIALGRSNSLTFTGTIQNCMASSGGAIYSGGGAITVSNSFFTGNTAEKGGAIYLNNAESAFSGNTFANNSATVSGGAVCLNLSSSEPPASSFDSDSFTGNTAETRGGAIDYEGVNHFDNACEYCEPRFEKISFNNCWFSANDCAAGFSYLSETENPTMYAIHQRVVTNLNSTSKYTTIYNNFDVCYISDHQEPVPQPPVIIRPVYTVELESTVALEMSETNPISWAEFELMLNPVIKNSAGEKVDAAVTLSSSDYAALNLAQAGSFTIKVCVNYVVSFLSYTEYVAVTVVIEDRTPPVIVTGEDFIDLENGTVPEGLEQLVELAQIDATDNAEGAVEVWAEVLLYDFAEIDWTRAGEYAVYVYAEDEAGNISRDGFIFAVNP